MGRASKCYATDAAGDRVMTDKLSGILMVLLLSFDRLIFSAVKVGKNIRVWIIIMKGAKNTIYEGETYRLR